MRKLFSIMFSAVLLLICSAQGTWAQNVKVWDLGTYPYGTWAEAGGINDLDVVVAQGDAADGDNHLFKAELFGSHAGQWFDLGALGAYENWFAWPLISDPGLIVGYAATSQGHVHGFVWTGKAERTDLGALPSLGRNNSMAVAVNKLGTLVAGSVWGETPGYRPVVWTPDIAWNSGLLAVSWKIHALETPNGFPYGYVNSMNNLGQLAGAVYNDDGIEVAALWNPVQGGKGWELIELPGSKDWPDVAIVGDINEKGEMVGDVLSLDWAHGYSSLWQPVDSQRRTYKLTLLPNPWGLPQGDTAEGINDLGDIVGASWDKDYNFVAVRWTTKDPTSVRSLGFPGDWSLAFKVNELGIATGTYGGGLCANECVAAVQFRPK